MGNPFEDMRRAVNAAREVNQAVNAQINALLDLLDGRLRHADKYRLKELKAQLRDFNANTKRWKKTP